MLLIGTAVVLFVLDWRLALATLAVIPLMALADGLVPHPLEPRLPPGARAHRARHGDARRGHLRHARRAVVSRASRATRRASVASTRATRTRTTRRSSSTGSTSRPSTSSPRSRPRSCSATAATCSSTTRSRSARCSRSSSTWRTSSTRCSSCPSSTTHFSLRRRRSTRSWRCSTRSPRSSTRRPRAALPRIEGHVALRERPVRLRDAARGAARDLLDVPAGTTVALVGQTGAGKSTIAKLIARFYDVREGRITIDGHDVREVEQKSLRRQLGVVPQEGFLFAGTVAENIAFAPARGDAGGDRRGGRAPSAPTAGSASSRTATRPSSASGASGSRSASGS